MTLVFESYTLHGVVVVDSVVVVVASVIVFGQGILHVMSHGMPV